MKRHPRYELTSPQVLALLSGVYVGAGRKFFIIDEQGKTRRFPLKQKLVQDLGMEQAAAGKLLATAPIPEGTYIRNRTKSKPEVLPVDLVGIIKATVEECRPGDIIDDLAVVQEEHVSEISETLPPPKPVKKPRLPERDEEPVEEAPEKKMKDYQIVQTSSGWWGVFSNDTATTTICGREREDALRELVALRRSKEAFAWPLQRYQYNPEK